MDFIEARWRDHSRNMKYHRKVACNNLLSLISSDIKACCIGFVSKKTLQIDA
jgi:hypothetical protein